MGGNGLFENEEEEEEAEDMLRCQSPTPMPLMFEESYQPMPMQLPNQMMSSMP